MSVRLEDELAQGMRERAAGLRPAPDLVTRALRAHRRRRRRRLILGGAGGLGAAVAAALLAGSAAGPTVAGGSGAPASAPEMLTVAQVSQRAVAALDAGEVLHAVGTLVVGGETQRTETWFDPETGDARRQTLDTFHDKAPREVWITGGTVTVVDPAARTWFRTTGTRVPVEKAAALAGDTPEELRTALRRGDLRLVGPETLDGTAVVHLRAEHPGGTDDLWVDAATYRTVRRVIVKDGSARIRLDYTWSPRTESSLAPLRVEIPPGFTRVDPPGPQTPAPR